MTTDLLIQQILTKKNYLTVGLDTTAEKLPDHLKNKKDNILNFNKAIIDATIPWCVAYKINTAFYETLGSRGWDIMEETMNYIPATHFKIADAKRGDIGNTSTQYARAFFETLNFDALTVAPYMGEDSIRPFLEYENKVTIVLGLTSNHGAADFEMIQAGDRKLYEHVFEKVASWGSPQQLMFVAGATQAQYLESIRKIVPEHFLLVPGVGFQGGSLKEVSDAGLTPQGGLLVNASRAIIYASSNENFADEAAEIAKQYQYEMQEYLTQQGIV